jgi:hypothetical protein
LGGHSWPQPPFEAALRSGVLRYTIRWHPIVLSPLAIHH